MIKKNTIKQQQIVTPFNIERTPSIFITKINNSTKPRLNSLVKNTISPMKHHPASTKEWFNSIYTYNNNSVKNLPALDKSLSKIIKSYFNSSIAIEDKNAKSQAKTRFFTRYKRTSLKNIFVGKAELKHTNDKVIITLYVFDGERNFLMKKFNSFRRLVFTNYKLLTFIKQSYKILPRTIYKYIGLNSEMSNLIRAYVSSKELSSLEQRDLFKNINNLNVNSHKLDFINNNFFKDKLSSQYFISNNISPANSIYAHQETNNFLMMETKELENVFSLLSLTSLAKSNFADGNIRDTLSRIKKEINLAINPFKETISSLVLNHNKFNRYILRLTPLISKLYGKKVEFNIIKLKTLYLNSDIFTQAISIKLKGRNNKILGVLRSALSLIKIPNMISSSERYIKDNRGLVWANKAKNLFVNSPITGVKNKDQVTSHFNDILSHKEIDSFGSELPKFVCANLKYKIMAGVRLEARGRLTKRLTASRAVFKVRWKGGLKDPESRYKGISTIMLRGCSKGNIDYGITNSSARNGAFGIKGWISGR